MPFGFIHLLVHQSRIKSAHAAFSVTHAGLKHRPPVLISPIIFAQQRRCYHPCNRFPVTQLLANAVVSSSNNDIEETKVTPPQKSMEETIREKELETLARICIPSIIIATVCYLIFPTVASTLNTEILEAYDGISTKKGAEALNLILQDNSNQFIQDMHNFCSLLFLLLTGHTFAFVYRQQEKLCYALFEEISTAKSLLEQVALATEGRPFIYHSLLEAMRRYVQCDLNMVLPTRNSVENNNDSDGPYEEEDIPALLLSTRPVDDPFETILYLTSVGEPSGIYSTVRMLRKARSKRLGAMQRKMPELNLYLLYVLGFIAWITFPVVAAGSKTVGGQALLNLQAVQLSLGVFAMGGVLGIINELKQPTLTGRSVYDVDFSYLQTVVEGLENEINSRMEKCDVKGTSLNKRSLLNNGTSNTLSNNLTINAENMVNEDQNRSNTKKKERFFSRIVKRIRRSR